MINLRYHIVSITAVFLALGIGLTLGSTFLDRVTVDTLKNQLDDVQVRVDETEAENGDLANRLGALEERDAAFAAELPERLLAGHLDGVPVLVVAAQGTDEALIDSTIGALSAGGARVAGTWLLTERWLLDDADEVSQLSDLLGLTTTDAGRLRRNAAIRVAELLEEAAQVPPPPSPAEGDDIPALDPEVVTPPSTEPAIVAELEAAGYVDYRALPGSGDERVLLPGGAARYVVVSGAAPDSGPHLFATALVEEAVADGVAPLVAAQGAVDLPETEADRPAAEDARRSTFVGPLRAGEITRERLSTVDDIDTAAGLAAVVLALEDLAEDRTGHYGVAPGAARLLPGSEPDT